MDQFGIILLVIALMAAIIFCIWRKLYIFILAICSAAFSAYFYLRNIAMLLLADDPGIFPTPGFDPEPYLTSARNSRILFFIFLLLTIVLIVLQICFKKTHKK